MTKKQLREDVIILILAVISLLLLGAVLFSVVEGWSFLDSFYFVTITATTVGYGDFIPTHPLSKIFTILYSLSIVPFVFYAFSFVAKSQMERVYTKIHHLERRQKTQEEEIATAEMKLNKQKTKIKEQEEELEKHEKELEKAARKISKEHKINKEQAEELEEVEDQMEDVLKK